MKRAAGQDPATTRRWRPATQAVRGGTWRSEQGETSEAIFVTSGFSYDDAETVAARFRGDDPGPYYSRTQNPSVQMLEQRIALMEGAEACRAQASGMAAMNAALLCHLSQGDHLVAARAAFGSCKWLIEALFPRFGISATTIDATDNAAWEAAIQPNTRAFFFETPANPTLDLVDLEHVCGLAHAHGILSVVDNAFCSPALQRPLDFGADVVAYSATKLMDGQGRVLAGAVCGSTEFIEDKLVPFQRNTGPTLAPFNAWVVLKGLETLELRARRQSETALALGRFVEPRVPRILHPGLESHPQFALANKQMLAPGCIFAFEVAGGARQAHAVLDALELVDISNNLGDSRTLLSHPASTTHYAIGRDKRAEMGVSDGLLRISVGLEDPDDLIEDLDQALRRAGL